MAVPTGNVDAQRTDAATIGAFVPPRSVASVRALLSMPFLAAGICRAWFTFMSELVTGATIWSASGEAAISCADKGTARRAFEAFLLCGKRQTLQGETRNPQPTTDTGDG